MSEEVKKCAHCGSVALKPSLVIYDDDKAGPLVHILCSGCPASMIGSPAGVVNAWNTRAPSSNASLSPLRQDEQAAVLAEKAVIEAARGVPDKLLWYEEKPVGCTVFPEKLHALILALKELDAALSRLGEGGK